MEQLGLGLQTVRTVVRAAAEATAPRPTTIHKLMTSAAADIARFLPTGISTVDVGSRYHVPLLCFYCFTFH
jgi:hypothetical protein